LNAKIVKNSKSGPKKNSHACVPLSFRLGFFRVTVLGGGEGMSWSPKSTKATFSLGFIYMFIHVLVQKQGGLLVLLHSTRREKDIARRYLVTGKSFTYTWGGGMSWSQNQQRQYSAWASFICSFTCRNMEACWFYFTVQEEKNTLPDAILVFSYRKKLHIYRGGGDELEPKSAKATFSLGLIYLLIHVKKHGGLLFL
jgi:hypothetical protein